MRNSNQMFHTRHYKALAQLLAEARADAAGHNYNAAFRYIEDAMVRLFENDNANFEADQFRAAANDRVR